MQFNIPLPTDDLYCPKLSCTVYDYIYKGWNQPIIGVFTLPIGQLMNDLIKERQEETEVMLKIEEDLSKIILDAKPAPPSKNMAINETVDEVENYSNYSGENQNLATDIENQKKSIAKQRKKASKKINGEESKDLTEGLGA